MKSLENLMDVYDLKSIEIVFLWRFLLARRIEAPDPRGGDANVVRFIWRSLAQPGLHLKVIGYDLVDLGYRYLFGQFLLAPGYHVGEQQSPER